VFRVILSAQTGDIPQQIGGATSEVGCVGLASSNMAVPGGPLWRDRNDNAATFDRAAHRHAKSRMYHRGAMLQVASDAD